MDESALTFRQRWATYLTLALTLSAMMGGALLRSSVENATLPFSDKETGISARYPAGWLLERGSGHADFVLRVQDPASLPFKTTLSVSLLPIGPNATANDVTQLLTVRRAQSLSAYQSLGITSTELPNGAPAIQMNYAYAAVDNNPFLQSLPVVVRAQDVIVISRGQAIVASYLSEATAFERNQHYFMDLLRGLVF